MPNNIIKKTFSLLGAGIMTLSLGIMITTGTLSAYAQTNPVKISVDGNFERGALFSSKENLVDIVLTGEGGQEFVLADTPTNSPLYNTIMNHRLGWFKVTGEAVFQPITLQGGYGSTTVNYRLNLNSKVTPIDIGLGKLFVINAPKGVVIRDGKCAKVGTQGYSYTVSLRSNKTINCNISGKNYKMTAITNIYGTVNTDSSDIYIASQFLSPLISNYNLSTDANPGVLKKYKVNNKAGLNLRDFNCKRKATVSNGTIVEQPGGGQGGAISICKVGKQFYEMTSVAYKGQVYQVAMALLANA